MITYLFRCTCILFAWGGLLYPSKGQSGIAEVLYTKGSMSWLNRGIWMPIKPGMKVPLTSRLRSSAADSATFFYSPENIKATVHGRREIELGQAFQEVEGNWYNGFVTVWSAFIGKRPLISPQVGATRVRRGGNDYLLAPMRTPWPNERVIPVKGMISLGWEWDGRPSYDLVISSSPDSSAKLYMMSSSDTSATVRMSEIGLGPEGTYYWTVLPVHGQPSWLSFGLISEAELHRLDVQLEALVKEYGLVKEDELKFRVAFWYGNRIYGRLDDLRIGAANSHR